VDGACRDFLAGADLTLNEDGRIARCQAPNQVQRSDECIGPTDQIELGSVQASTSTTDRT
jgi:hypothetical protein